MLIRSKQENGELRAELETLPRLKDRLRTLELQVKVTSPPLPPPLPTLCVPPLHPCYAVLPTPMIPARQYN